MEGGVRLFICLIVVNKKAVYLQANSFKNEFIDV